MLQKIKSDLVCAIPTLGMDEIIRTLDALALSITLPRTIILYYSGSTEILHSDQFKDLEEIFRIKGVQLKVRNIKRVGIGRTRGIMLNEIFAPYVLFLDDDVLIEPNVIDLLLTNIGDRLAAVPANIMPTVVPYSKTRDHIPPDYVPVLKLENYPEELEEDGYLDSFKQYILTNKTVEVTCAGTHCILINQKSPSARGVVLNIASTLMDWDPKEGAEDIWLTHQFSKQGGLALVGAAITWHITRVLPTEGWGGFLEWWQLAYLVYHEERPVITGMDKKLDEVPMEWIDSCLGVIEQIKLKYRGV